MKLIGRPLGDWDVKINYGIKTGYNDAFIIDSETRDRLIGEDPRSEEILKPVLRGRDIRRFKATWAGLYLIATIPALNIDITNYPAVMNHLLSFGRDRLEQAGKRLASRGRSRKKTSHSWFELQDSIAYHGEFSKEKLLWIELADRGRFCHDDSGLYGEATTFLLTGKELKYLCAVLNSTLTTWFLHQAAPTSGAGTLRWKKVYIQKIPIPMLGRCEASPFVNFVDKILESKSEMLNADTCPLELDRMVYDLYGLTGEETGAVEAWRSAQR